MLVSIASGTAQQTAALRGVVRNNDGVPQMGVVVELLGADARVVANAFTDLNGRFALRNVTPGVYQVRASAALYLPALRSHLRLRAGDLPTVDLMLSGLFDQAWPERVSRRGDLSDDWRWTLRSSANRPLLRVLDPDSQLSPAPAEAGRARQTARASASYLAGGFGDSGLASTVDLQRVAGGESSTSFLHLASVQRGNGPSGIDAAAGLERHTAQGLVRKTAVRVQSRPGILKNGQASEFVVADAEAGERLPLGDLGEIESGALLRTYHLAGTTVVASHPFLRVVAAPSSRWDLTYSLAGDPECQSLEDVGTAWSHPYTVGSDGSALRPEQGLHQALSVRRHVGRASLSATVNRDSWRRVTLTAAPRTGPNSSMQVGLVDPTNGTALLVANGFSGQGWLMTIAVPVNGTTDFSIAGGEDLALGAKAAASPTTIANSVAPVRASFVRTSVQSRLSRTGTRVKVAYSWQPNHVVTVVAPYDGANDGAYLSLHVRQPLRAGSVFRDGAVLTLDASNLLGQGYVALASSEMGPLPVAGTLRTIQGGLAFTF